MTSDLDVIDNTVDLNRLLLVLDCSEITHCITIFQGELDPLATVKSLTYLRYEILICLNRFFYIMLYISLWLTTALNWLKMHKFWWVSSQIAKRLSNEIEMSCYICIECYVLLDFFSYKILQSKYKSCFSVILRRSS